MPHPSRLLQWLACTLLTLSVLCLPQARAQTPGLYAQSLYTQSLYTQSLYTQSLYTQSLYTQSIQAALTPSTRGLEMLLLDLRTSEILADTFAQSATPIPVGSLLKPFLALAFGQAHHDTFPSVTCHGQADRCWLPAGHGTLTLPQAIAQSCNAYFLALARTLAASSIPFLPPPPAGATPETLIGLNASWPIAPEALLRGYARMLSQPPSATQAAILQGMRASALHGTAVRIGPHPGGVLTKTGTAPCIEVRCKASGDGLLIAAVPATHPTLLLLVRRRGTTGAQTAAAASAILTRLEALHAE